MAPLAEATAQESLKNVPFLGSRMIELPPPPPQVTQLRATCGPSPHNHDLKVPFVGNRSVEVEANW